MAPISRSRARVLHSGVAALLIIGLAACGPADEAVDPSPTDPAATAAAGAPTDAQTTDPADGPDAAAPATTDASADPGAAPEASAPVACGDAFVLAQFEHAPRVWEGDEAQQLASAEPSASFAPEAAIAGLEAICVTTYRTPIDVPPGVSSVSVAIVDAAGGSAFAAVDAWAAEQGYQRAEYGDFLEYSLMAGNGNAAAKLIMIVAAPGLTEPEWAAIASLDVADTDLIVRHVDFGQE